MYGRPISNEPTADKATELAEIQELVRSTYVGTVLWADKDDFANVKGSTHDPKIDGLSWIGLWSKKCNNNNAPQYCTSHNWFSNDHDRPCNGDLIGGHVITGQASSREPEGATVYIYPICTRHNANNNSYMHVLYNNRGVQLKYWE
ncbi:MAG: hypothetical protein BGP09_32490 [Rhizobium sp. 60-20]|jgi:hypothetical protein|nr:MAG: hypothetical protein BGP09_32490 [Rhizobium sp. 60-20]RKD35611.1 hypothetical protein BJ928_13820 [Rhizobium sp. WW_1]